MSSALDLPRTPSAAEKREALARALRSRSRQQRSVAPLSHGQQALWFLYCSAPESAAYHVSFSPRIRSRVDATALREALQALVDRHASLRAVFRLQDGEPVQEIAGERPLAFEVVDCPGLDDAALRQRLADAYAQPFDLEQGPPLRVQLFSRAPDDHVLLLTVHHIVYDAWSLWLNLEELRRLYAARAASAPAALPPLRHSYRDAVQQQHEQLAGPAGERLWQFWKSELAGELGPLGLPTDRPRPPVQTYHGASHRFELAAPLAGALRRLAQAQGVTPFMLLLAAYQVLLHRHSGQDDIRVGSPTSGRTDAKFAGVVGYFVNPVVLRTSLAGAPSFTLLLQRVLDTVVRALEHQDFPFPLLVERLAPRRDPSYSPLFQVSFVYQKPQHAGAASDWLRLSAHPGERSDWDGLAIEYYDLPQQEGQFELELEVLETDESFPCLLKYNTDLFDASTIARWARHFETLLAGLVADPELPIDRLPLLGAAERRQILDEWNATQVAYPQGAWVHQLAERQARATPAATALVYGERRLSYAEFNARANRLAHRLAAAGVGRGAVVGVCLERSPGLVLALHAILKLGAAYLPLDPEYPAERLAYMAHDAGVALLVTGGADRAALPGVETLVLAGEEPDLGRFPDHDPQVEIAPDDLAYVIYTSGSTGRPKGVAVPHRGLLNRLQWMQQAYPLGAGDRVLQKTPYSFDVSVWEFFWPFMAGAALVVAPPGEHRDSRRLVELIQRHEITTLHFVPSMLRAFLDDEQAAGCGSLRRIICSGEALPHDLQQRCLGTFAADLHNLYGPTEASIDVSHWTCRRDARDTVVPIGFPIANTSLYVLDRALNPVPIGIAGELHIGGVGLARGYLNNPALTREKFIPDPFGHAPGGRLYKTGDLARFRPDGSLEYLGRLDHQVKLRGFRIELCEIETVLVQQPGVQAAVVVAREQRLVAYVAAEPGAFVPAALRERLAALLPDHMVPSLFMRLDALPLSANGKVDRGALPAPEAALGERAADFVPPRDAFEQRLVPLWQAVLGVPVVGVRDSFFELGGHSLLAVNLMSRIEREFGRRLPLATLLRRPTIEALAGALREQRPAGAVSALVPIQPRGGARPFFCAAGGGGSVLYYYALAQQLGPEQPFYGLQAPGLDGECEPLASVEALAAAYLSELRSAQPRGPYVLGGHCFGGLVAFEMAQQLRRQGEDVARVVLIDVPARRPAEYTDASPDDPRWTLKFAALLQESFGVELGLGAAELATLEPEAQLRRLHERVEAAGLLPPGAGPAKLRALLRVFATQSTIRYEPRSATPVPLTVLRAGEVHPDYDFSPADDPGTDLASSTMGWSAYALGEVAVHVVPGNHITMMAEPHVRQLAESIRRCLGAAELADRCGAREPAAGAAR